MIVDCRWLNTHLEEYSCGNLRLEEQQLAESHLEHCEACRLEIQSLKDIDPLIKSLFQHRLALARASKSPRHVRTGAVAAFAGLAAAAVLAFLFLKSIPGDKPPGSDGNHQTVAEAPTEPPTLSSPYGSDPKKDGNPSEVLLLKPDVPPTGPSTPAAASGQASPKNMVDFAVVDPAGYIWTLDHYRGYVLLFGVWSSGRPETAANLEQLYRAFGKNTKLRVVGISNGSQDAPAGSTFPRAFNHDSRLLGAMESEYVVVNPSGEVVSRGSLRDDAASLLKTVRSTLAPLDIR